jgi:hypothetical protein
MGKASWKVITVKIMCEVRMVKLFFAYGLCNLMRDPTTKK